MTEQSVALDKLEECIKVLEDDPANLSLSEHRRLIQASISLEAIRDLLSIRKLACVGDDWANALQG